MIYTGMNIPQSVATLNCGNSQQETAADCDCQRAPNVALHDAILTGNATAIRDIMKTCLADSPLHSPIGFLGKVHPQHRAILPIHLAVIYRKVQSLDILLHSGADPELRDHHGRNALHLLISHWPRGNGYGSRPHGKFERSVAAAQQSSVACLRLLCGVGLDVNARVESDSRHTALHLAVRHGALPAVGILARRGAHVNAADRLGVLPLHMAVGTLDLEMTASLLRCGAGLDGAVRQSGATALHMAVLAVTTKAGRALPGDLRCIGELLVRGAFPDVRDRAGRTPLHEACQDAQEEVADMLLGHGADVNVRTAFGENCLFLFLDREANLQCASLLGKLLSLTYPFAVTNSRGLLPRGLLLPEHRCQRDKLLQLCKQPLGLQHICRIHICRQYGDRFRQNLKEIVPEKLYDFVYSCAPPGITFCGVCDSASNEAP